MVAQHEQSQFYGIDLPLPGNSLVAHTHGVFNTHDHCGPAHLAFT